MKKVMVLMVALVVMASGLSFANSYEYYRIDSMKHFEFVERGLIGSNVDYIILRDTQRCIEIKFYFFSANDADFKSFHYDYDYKNDILIITDSEYRVIYSDLMVDR